MNAINEIAKQIKNIFVEGTVCDVRRINGDEEIRAEIVNNGSDKRVSDWLSVRAMSANSRVKRYDPIQVGDSVFILSPDGRDGYKAVAIPGRWCKSVQKPALANDTTSVTQYNDGTIITYDTAAKKLFISLAGDAQIDVAGNVDLTVGGNVSATVSGDLDVIAANAEIKADSVVVDSPSIDLGKGGAGVVTGECYCHITGTPHMFISDNTRSKK
jgi:phage baseplate assembly protein V